MRRITVITISTCMMVIYVNTSVAAQALSQPVRDVIITELQTGNKTANEEFIELYNTTDHDIDFADTAHQGKNIWKIQFFSSTKVTATGFNWDPKTPGITTFSLTSSGNSSVVIGAHSYFLISTSSYTPGGIDADLTYTSGHLSDSGGGVQLVDTSGVGVSQVVSVHDHLGWYKPSTGLSLPANLYLTPLAGSSLQRTMSNEDYALIDAELSRFISSDLVSPKEAWLPPLEPPIIQLISGVLEAEASNEIEPITPNANFGNGGSQVVVIAALGLLPIQITELLPNPMNPQTDAKDEYIELFNPNDQIVNLVGYTLQTGLKFSYSYTFQDSRIEPRGFIGLKSSESHLSLANSGGQARLLDASGSVASQTAAYTAAPEGQAWAVQNNIWQWTTIPTFARKNIFNYPPDSLGQSVPPSPKATATTTIKKPALPKSVPTAKPKPETVKVAKTAKSNTNSKKPSTLANKSQPAPLHSYILVGVGLIAVIYGLYEYRKDLANKFYQLRRNRASRRAARAAT